MIQFQLYHGTDARTSRMTDEERKAFRKDILEALDYMWDLMTPYFQQFDDVIDREHNIIRPVERILQFKEVMEEKMWDKLYRGLTHDNNRRKRYSQWQYQDNLIYLTADIRTAVSYAYHSFVFGELGDTLWDMYQGMLALKLETWDPSPKIQSTFDKAKKLAEEDHFPIVYILDSFDYTLLKRDTGESISEEDIKIYPNFRYEDEYVVLNPNDRFDTIYLRPKDQVDEFVKKR